MDPKTVKNLTLQTLNAFNELKNIETITEQLYIRDCYSLYDSGDLKSCMELNSNIPLETGKHRLNINTYNILSAKRSTDALNGMNIKYALIKNINGSFNENWYKNELNDKGRKIFNQALKRKFSYSLEDRKCSVNIDEKSMMISETEHFGDKDSYPFIEFDFIRWQKTDGYFLKGIRYDIKTEKKGFEKIFSDISIEGMFSKIRKKYLT